MTFEEAFLPHLDAAYNLARWLTRNEADAQDVVQDAYLRAFRFFNSFHGTDGRAWLLAIVRNAAYTWLRRNKSAELPYDSDEAMQLRKSDEPDPETLQVIRFQRQLVREAIEELPLEFREVIILRELEELSYKEIAVVTGIPIGTVMSRLARARHKLQTCFRGSSRNGRSTEGIKEPAPRYLRVNSDSYIK
jgi:RNA polymerase sigma-70 factor (ECF subfamily)